ncbi:MAG: stage III sporulation AC/AD family protein [Eubacteriales bacterium]
MDGFLQVIAMVLLSVVLTLLLKSHSPALALTLGLVTLIGLCVYGFTTLQSVMVTLSQLEDLTGLRQDILSPVLKTALVGVLTNMAAAICADGGQGGVAKMVEVCGSAVALYLSLPLITAVLDMLTAMLGG